MSWRAESHCPHFSDNALRLPGTNIDPMTSELKRCQQRVQVPILNPFALFFLFLIFEDKYSGCRELQKINPAASSASSVRDEDDVMHHICREIITNNTIAYDE